MQTPAAEPVRPAATVIVEAPPRPPSIPIVPIAAGVLGLGIVAAIVALAGR